MIGYSSAGGLSSSGYYGYCLPYGYQYCPPPPPPPPPPRPADHYLKYLTDASSRDGEIVTLIDQFGTLTVQMHKPITFMVPAEKRRVGRPPTPINNPADHLVCYKLPNELQSLNRTVHISNQFRTSTLVVGQPIELCAPASKSLSGQPDPGPPPTRLDHYLCYDVLSEQPDDPSETMTAIDQFRSQSIRIDVARDLCNPVEKRRQGRPATPITQPEIHFVCYRITTTSPSWRQLGVNTRDQFGVEHFRLPYQRRLCMPSSKQP